MAAMAAGSGPRLVRHIAVVGLMGSGKSSVGSRIAATLGWPMRDSDADIEASQGHTVRELRDTLGTDAMHALESRQLLDALAAPGMSVVCPAASVADDDACLAALGQADVAVVFLTVDPAIAAKRFAPGDHRPWYGSDPVVFLAAQAATRYPRFRSVNPVELATDTNTPDEVAALALAQLAARGVHWA
jgi:shikimate kinase